MDEAEDSSSADTRQCRICWGEEGDPALGLALVSPCKCAGSLNYMHVKCLEDWQQVLRSQGQFRKARHCEICKQPYKLNATPSCSRSRGNNGWWTYVSRLLSRASQQVLDLLNCRSYTDLLYRCWKLYVVGSSVMGAARAGAAGLRAGFGMGKTLVEEQTSILLNLLSALGDLLGTPYAELLWCQAPRSCMQMLLAVACVAFALVSELVYTSVLGLVAGSVVGFFRGYLSAVHTSVNVVLAGMSRGWRVGRGLAKAASAALRVPRGALRAVSALAAKKLPVRLL
ncbi:hypothetical protein VOLCADRAFT_106514 [Volvox carteri f. nagariensis]|uniref:RING-CH-type domain-containing protein n=1 Tax=Volvox carteri f. nagariensis TaxID=3068 RepID=D8U813_VOLCA|nr:uncharacterized protein VOLCADRAFT_106514 [Volvox carteri f. nagariensis]EFJ44137.1 hypothetical protein VOLCADRAFT_106514 [Volvox carteri f. nagariensis]|eukprot:XP_002954731.1 hypothetical protein VOLCADRAFT_106514 [Volvox carteri f. nagariensis]